MNTSNFNISFNFIIKFCSFITIVSLISCEKEKQDLSIIIKNGDGIEITGDTVTVSINTVHQTLVDVTFSGASPKYSRQINQGNIDQLSKHEDYELISNGVNNSGDFEKVVITTSFSDTLLHIGSIVKISVRVETDMVESVFYKVNQ